MLVWQIWIYNLSPSNCCLVLSFFLCREAQAGGSCSEEQFIWEDCCCCSFWWWDCYSRWGVWDTATDSAGTECIKASVSHLIKQLFKRSILRTFFLLQFVYKPWKAWDKWPSVLSSCKSSISRLDSSKEYSWLENQLLKLWVYRANFELQYPISGAYQANVCWMLTLSC